MKFTIRECGTFMGVYQASTPEEALDVYADDFGWANYAEKLAQARFEGNESIVDVSVTETVDPTIIATHTDGTTGEFQYESTADDRGDHTRLRLPDGSVASIRSSGFDGSVLKTVTYRLVEPPMGQRTFRLQVLDYTVASGYPTMPSFAVLEYAVVA